MLYLFQINKSKNKRIKNNSIYAVVCVCARVCAKPHHHVFRSLNCIQFTEPRENGNNNSQGLYYTFQHITRRSFEKYLHNLIFLFGDLFVDFVFLFATGNNVHVINWYVLICAVEVQSPTLACRSGCKIKCTHQHTHTPRRIQAVYA